MPQRASELALQSIYSIASLNKYVVSSPNRRGHYVGWSCVKLLSKIPELEEFFEYKYDKYVSRKDPEYVEAFVAGRISNHNLKYYNKDRKSHLNHFFRFVEENEPGIKCDLSVLLSKTRIKSFLKFLNILKRAPNTIANHAKTFAEVYKWIELNFIELDHLKLDDRLLKSVMDFVKDERQAYRIRNNNVIANAKSGKELLKQGKFFTQKELQELYSFCLYVAEQMLQKKKNVTEEDILTFQDCLITLSMLSIGAQRKEFILLMTILNIVQRDSGWFLTPPPEKTVRKSTEGIPLPEWFAALLIYYRDEIRPLLPQYDKDTLGLWVNRNGKHLNSKTINTRIQNFVKSLFPDKNVTAIDFRRALPSIIWEANLRLQGKSLQDFLVHYATLVNTSPDVLDKHYIRSSVTTNLVSTIRIIEDQILNTATAITSKRAIVDHLEIDAVSVVAVEANMADVSHLSHSECLTELRRLQQENFHLRQLCAL
jgi:site-specific recombinase XerD